MQISTWNVAGLRSRLDSLCAWISLANPDIVCLQEIKCVAEKFPQAIFDKLGYDSILNVQAQFNGVGILFKKNIEILSINPSNSILEKEARFIEASFNIHNQIMRIACLYAPNGNPKASEKYKYKIQWLEKLASYTTKNVSDNLILAGDFNIIPTPKDAYDINLWLNDALYADEVRNIYKKICNMGFTDVFTIDETTHDYSFWDFRQNAWQKNNGIRIDFILASPLAMSNRIKLHNYRDTRGWEKPSDHVPIAIEIS